ncbi:MAG: hypothetical protein ACK5H1_00195 [Tenacibaculum sp.]
MRKLALKQHTTPRGSSAKHPEEQQQLAFACEITVTLKFEHTVKLKF